MLLFLKWLLPFLKNLLFLLIRLLFFLYRVSLQNIPNRLFARLQNRPTIAGPNPVDTVILVQIRNRLLVIVDFVVSFVVFCGKAIFVEVFDQIRRLFLETLLMDILGTVTHIVTVSRLIVLTDDSSFCASQRQNAPIHAVFYCFRARIVVSFNKTFGLIFSLCSIDSSVYFF